MTAGAAGETSTGRSLRRLACIVLLAAVCVLIPAADAVAVDPVIAAAGDIACSASSSNYNSGNGTSDKCRQKYTSDLLVNAGLAAVLPLGDTQYENATLSGLNNSYNPTWGRVKSITRPAPGNHEYKTANASGYFDYFNGTGVANGPAGDRTKGYYSFNVGTWHLIALNSTDHCTLISCAAGSAQEVWLKADLAANPNYCTLAFWHDPRFNSGHDGNADEMAPLFQALYNADADVVLGGHAHDYERFAPQNPSAALDNARGIRQFVVGSGGAFWTSIGTPKPNSQVRQNNTYGVLKLTLHPTTYDWQFVPEAGKTFTDSGTGACHGSTPPPVDTTKPTVPGNLRATAGSGQVALLWNASTDNVAVTGYNVYRGTTLVTTVGSAVTSYTDTGLAPGSYTYTVRATDAAANLSDPSNAVSATVVDSQKPTPPGTLTATAGPRQVALSWQASSDNVGVTGYRVLRGGVQVGTVGGTVTSYTDPNLAAGTYSYTVVAVDAAANPSDPSNSASATVPDTTKPGVPGNLVATGGVAQVNLTWQAATDDVAVTGYRIYRNGNEIASVGTVTSYQDQLLLPATYSYTVRAVDAATNLSDPSNTASATVPDTTNPSAPGNLTASAPTSNQADLSWTASNDDVGVTGYDIRRNGQPYASIGPATSWSDTAVAATVTYTYQVYARDAAGHVSAPSTASVTVPDTLRPTVPANLTASLNGANTAALSWSAANDNVAVTGYTVYRNGTPLASVGTTTLYDDQNLAPGAYTYEVRARDAAGNNSDPSTSAGVTVLDVDGPTVPGNLSATAAGSTHIDLAWEASTDNVGVTGYDIYRDGQPHVSVGPVTSWSDGVTAPATHTYEVRAHDAAGNPSGPSNSATATVVPPDRDAPTAPGNLSATRVGAAQVDLTWDASTDDRAVTGYVVQRNGAVIATLGPATTYSDQNVPPGSYTYEVLAFDAADNISDPSDTASATIPDVDPPTAPGNLTATAAGRRTSTSTGRRRRQRRGDGLRHLSRRHCCTRASDRPPVLLRQRARPGHAHVRRARPRRGHARVRPQQLRHRDRAAARHRGAHRSRQPAGGPQRGGSRRPQLGGLDRQPGGHRVPHLPQRERGGEHRPRHLVLGHEPRSPGLHLQRDGRGRRGPRVRSQQHGERNRA